MTYNQIDDFNYDLPKDLIAQFPLGQRTASRLMHVNSKNKNVTHRKFTDLSLWVNTGDLIVLNNTKVIPARLYGTKATGGKIECLIERLISDSEALAHIRASKPPKAGSKILLADAFEALVLNKESELYHLKISAELKFLNLLEKHGSIPLPPYIIHKPTAEDLERYQTVFAYQSGAVAAPTAGLHFDQNLIDSLKAKGVNFAYITLHVGAGTFQPVRVNNLDEHKMHSEFIHFSQETYQAIKNCQASGNRVIAVGTTVARCLETVAAKDLQSYSGETNLFIRPGYTFKWINALITNFHLPQSTLLMLVSAFGGYTLIRNAYSLAIEERYRFFSYGDAMLIE